MTPQRNLLILSIRDFFTPPILKLAIFPFIITMVLLYGLFFILADIGLDQLENASVQIEQSQTTMRDGHPHTETVSADLAGSGILKFLLQYSITSWLVSFLIYTVGSFFILLLSVVIALAVIGFLTPPILRVIQQRHYPEIELVGYGHFGTIAWQFVKSFFIMLGLLFLLLPFYFIPILNIVALNLPFYYFFHKLMVFDVASTITTKEEYALIHVKSANSVRIKTFMLYLVSLIPFAILFATAFYVIYLGHTFLSETQKLRYPELEEAHIDAPKTLTDTQ
ncbi:MAG: EI24 domain-containing protein [Campylobacterota bacterium]|nr:EI24 domain-containing protein [Campylobacterota bacterium]